MCVNSEVHQLLPRRFTISGVPLQLPPACINSFAKAGSYTAPIEHQHNAAVDAVLRHAFARLDSANRLNPPGQNPAARNPPSNPNRRPLRFRLYMHLSNSIQAAPILASPAILSVPFTHNVQGLLAATLFGFVDRIGQRCVLGGLGVLLGCPCCQPCRELPHTRAEWYTST